MIDAELPGEGDGERCFIYTLHENSFSSFPHATPLDETKNCEAWRMHCYAQKDTESRKQHETTYK
jgi:hypothetical protein